MRSTPVIRSLPQTVATTGVLSLPDTTSRIMLLTCSFALAHGSRPATEGIPRCRYTLE
ncbi:hypothetical protein GCM10011333_22010 [Sediminivirga luteola]|uniref:Uncharacterized protein n=1 Tax=Sediminivirga luteola TaxID=1774748 RepID=A0A8J2XL20_9MICO|nr:hypothetical protein GCM10011333_22010 [Sediminivirga luteola]